MEATSEYKQAYNTLRKILLEVDLNSRGLDAIKKQFLINKSHEMKDGKGLTEEDTLKLPKILMAAFHSDYNPELYEETAKQISPLLGVTRTLAKSGEVKSFEGKNVSEKIDNELSEVWINKLISNIEKRKSSDAKFGNEINKLVEQYINNIRNATTITRMNDLFEDFFNETNKYMMDLKKQYFQSNNLNSSFDFEVTNNMNLEQLFTKLQNAKIKSEKETQASLEAIISEFSDLSQSPLKVLVNAIKQQGINKFKSGNISYAEAESFLRTNLTNLRTNKVLYTNRINNCNRLKTLTDTINSFVIKEKLSELVKGIYSNEAFEQEMSELETEVNLIKKNKLDTKIINTVEVNYFKLLSDPNNGVSEKIEITKNYNEFLKKVKDYQNKELGIDSLYFLAELFKNKEIDNKIISYVNGDYSNGDPINPDLVMITESIFENQINVFYRQQNNSKYSDEKFKYLNIQNYMERSYNMCNPICSLTEFLCNMKVSSTSTEYIRLFTNDLLGTYKNIVLEYNKRFEKFYPITFNHQTALSHCSKSKISSEDTVEKNYKNPEWIKKVVLNDIAKNVENAIIRQNNNFFAFDEISELFDNNPSYSTESSSKK